MVVFLKIVSIIFGLFGCYLFLFVFGTSSATSISNRDFDTPNKLFLNKYSGVVFAIFLLAIQLFEFAWMFWNNTQPYIIVSDVLSTHWLRSVGNKFVIISVVLLMHYLIGYFNRKNDFEDYKLEIFNRNQMNNDLKMYKREYYDSMDRTEAFAYTIITEMSLDETLYITDNYDNVYEIIKSLCTNEFGEYHDYTINTIYKGDEKSFLDDIDMSYNVVNNICGAFANGDIRLVPKHKMEHIFKMDVKDNLNIPFYLSLLN